MPFVGYAPSSIHEPREKHCYRCGSELGMGTSVLVMYRRRSRLVEMLSMLAFPYIWLKNFYDFRFGGFDWKCRVCRADTERKWREDVLGCEPHVSPKRSPFGPVRRTVAVTEGGLPAEMSAAPFPVYGLAGQTYGMALRSVTWETGRVRPSVRRVALLYEAVEGVAPRPRLLLEQSAAGVVDDHARPPERELRAIVQVVEQHGARGQRERYADRGNVFRHWNLRRLAAAPRRSMTLHVGGSPAQVEVAQWSDPQQVTLAHVRLESASVMAAAVDVAPARLLAMLKGLAPLG